MIKTQIQLPEELHRDLKRLAEAKEWSLAETLRRGAELLLARYPYIAESNLPWSAPESRDLGWRGLMHDQIHAASLGDMEPRLPDMLNDHGRS